MPAQQTVDKPGRKDGHGARRQRSRDWPEAYGFTTTSGKGPCYVISVERGSSAHRAGICPGDQIVELDGRNVTEMSADAIRTLATLTLTGRGQQVCDTCSSSLNFFRVD